MEIKTEVKVVYHKIRMLCDGCKEGDMISTGIMLPSFPAQYKHCCNICTALENYPKNYPHIEQEYV